MPFKLAFNHGGAIEFGKCLLELGTRASKLRESYKVPSAPPASDIYAAPPPAYTPFAADAYYSSFMAQHPAFAPPPCKTFDGLSVVILRLEFYSYLLLVLKLTSFSRRMRPRLTLELCRRRTPRIRTQPHRLMRRLRILGLPLRRRTLIHHRRQTALKPVRSI